MTHYDVSILFFWHIKIHLIFSTIANDVFFLKFISALQDINLQFQWIDLATANKYTLGALFRFSYYNFNLRGLNKKVLIFKSFYFFSVGVPRVLIDSYKLKLIWEHQLQGFERAVLNPRVTLVTFTLMFFFNLPKEE